MFIPCVLVDCFSLFQDSDVTSSMALAGGDETDAAVAVFVVVPGNEIRHPAAGVFQAFKWFIGEAGPVLAGLEQRFPNKGCRCSPRAD